VVCVSRETFGFLRIRCYICIMTDLEARITQIEERNKKVEAEKAWETSLFRKISLVALTYCIMVAIFYSMGTPGPFRNAIVPTVGYLLSTLSLAALKSYWLQMHL